MAQQHFLQCDCGKQNVVRIQQAGAELACVSCGQMLQIPQMRAIHELPVVPGGAATPSSVGWGLGRGILFSLGLALLLIGSTVAVAYGLRRAQLDVSRPAPIDPNLNLDFQKLNPLQAWTLWENARDKPLFRRTPRYLRNRELSAAWLKIVSIGGAVGAVGLTIMLGALLTRPK